MSDTLARLSGALSDRYTIERKLDASSRFPWAEARARPLRNMS